MSGAGSVGAVPAAALARYLDGLGRGAGEVRVAPIGDGHSNLTFLVERTDARLVLRRPPLGPLAPSAHDVVREARLLTALAAHGVPVPAVLDICEDPATIGAPFYLMEHVDGLVLTDPRLPASLRGREGQVVAELADRLAALHAVDAAAPDLAGFGRPDGYLARQLKRFGALLERNATRPLPDLDQVTEWLLRTMPRTSRTAVVHGDYRLGNVMFAPTATVAVILDWEMGTIGDPLADLGYLTATWSDPGDPPNPVGDLSAATRLFGFPGRDALVRRYEETAGRAVAERLPWYQVLALWKAAIFLEGNYRRYTEGTTTDPYIAGLEHGVPAMAALARRRATAIGW